ncbi:ABC transporter ATP-binding protein [Actinoplanes sp. NPDC051851]|uniref:ABC transporter ATP-binding protein n=1 Tax=Actinoplanes sp. NPDC051851 TaxID=3154753 RepID=UPI003412CAA9
MSLLSVSGVSARHGLLTAVREVTCEVEEGETVALVGANGAGKSTLLRTLAGAHPASAGRIAFGGHDVTHRPAHRRTALGMVLVPEGRRLFPGLTVAENLAVAARRARPGPWDTARVYTAFPALEPLRSRDAVSLSGGEQQMTAIARGLLSNPRLLMIDEVSLGLSPAAVDTVYRAMDEISDRPTLLLVEQDLARALAVADRVICLLEGQIVLSAPSREVTREQVTSAYFGLRRAPA